MVFKVNKLGKVKTSIMIDPQVLKQARIEAVKARLTVSNVVEEALQKYLQWLRQQREQEIQFRLE